ncbi:MAG TPA: hypothetical protein VGL65_11995 [Gemmatimonadales bacterium]|jgi:hypothetical protein
MDFSVAICTHVPAGARHQALGTVSHLRANTISDEIVVIENAACGRRGWVS